MGRLIEPPLRLKPLPTVSPCDDCSQVPRPRTLPPAFIPFGFDVCVLSHTASRASAVAPSLTVS